MSNHPFPLFNVEQSSRQTGLGIKYLEGWRSKSNNFQNVHRALTDRSHTNIITPMLSSLLLVKSTMRYNIGQGIVIYHKRSDSLETDMTILPFSRIPLFASLSADNRRELEQSMRRISLYPGEILCHEGERGDAFYIVLQGEVEIIKAIDTAEERRIRVLGPGKFLGEIALLDPEGLRTATVRAQTESSVACLTSTELDALMQRRPALVLEIVRVLARRLREADDATISDLRSKNSQLAKAYAELKTTQAQIIEKERLERELQLAHDLQQSILPQVMPHLPSYNFGAVMNPARAVGGDFFDFIPLGHDDMGIVVADVSDKGMPAAIFMALTRSLVRAEASRGVFPAEVLRRVNQHLIDINESGMFVTLLYGILHGRTGEFLYARAGHDLPLILDDEGRVIATPQGSGQLLGLFPNPDLDEQTIAIPQGGKLVLYTDGVTDAVDSEETIFDVRRFTQSVRQHRGLSAQALCDQVLTDVASFQGTTPQFDDITLVIVERAKAKE